MIRTRLLATALLLAGTAGRTQAQGVDLTGAGATFPNPIYSKWFSTYATKQGVKINYQSIGSGGGIRQLSEQTVDFGATDGPMSDDEMGKAKGGRIIHVPTVIGAVAITYNLPGLTQPLNLDGGIVADLFLGKIKKWNDSRIAKLNPGVAIPDKNVLVVHRSDGSGTTYIFTDYLSTVSKEWLSGPGRGKEVQWPAGLGGKGNEGVAGQVRQLAGSVGYVELAYARQNKLAYAAVKNASGAYVLPSVEAATAAAEGVAAKLSPKSDYRISIVNAPGAKAYPISSFTWIILYQQQPDAAKGKKLVDFLKWALTTGQADAPTLDYAPLPSVMAQRLVERLGTVKVGA
ncbi:MAG: phosphate ABC transporter substrate-binding protein PstS [Gemmatimonadaceae bacterium]